MNKIQKGILIFIFIFIFYIYIFIYLYYFSSAEGSDGGDGSGGNGSSGDRDGGRGPKTHFGVASDEKNTEHIMSSCLRNPSIEGCLCKQ